MNGHDPFAPTTVTLEVSTNKEIPGPYALKMHEITITAGDFLDEDEAREVGRKFLADNYKGYGRIVEVDNCW